MNVHPGRRSGARVPLFVTAATTGLGETVVQGRCESDGVLRPLKPMLRADRHAVVRRGWVPKCSLSMVFAEKVAGRSSVTLDVAEPDRHRFSIDDASDGIGAYAQIIEKHYQRRWTSSGRWDGVDGEALHPPGAARNGEVPRAVAARSKKFTLKRYSRCWPRAIDERSVSARYIVHDPKKWTKVRTGDVLVADI